MSFHRNIVICQSTLINLSILEKDSEVNTQYSQRFIQRVNRCPQLEVATPRFRWGGCQTMPFLGAGSRGFR